MSQNLTDTPPIHVQENVSHSEISDDSSASSTESTSLYDSDSRKRIEAHEKRRLCQLRRRARNRRYLTALLNCASSSTEDSDSTFHLSDALSESTTTSESDGSSRVDTEDEHRSDYSSDSSAALQSNDTRTTDDEVAAVSTEELPSDDEEYDSSDSASEFSLSINTADSIESDC